MSAILTLNAGSSSIKYSVFLAAGNEPQALASGQIDALGSDAKLILKTNGEKTVSNIGQADHEAGLKAVLDALQPILGTEKVTGIGHRIVHGGIEYSEPIVLTPSHLEKLAELSPLAPLHQPHNLVGIQAAMHAFPQATQVGCFDSGFHRNHPFVNDTYALPRKFYDEGIRRYGFHGISFDYISGYIEETYPELQDARIVIAHLGNGCSMCCTKGRQSIATTLGFSTMDGLPMGTRCGQLDPGIILYLLDKGLSKEEVTNIIYKESGLKGLSGISNDMRTLLASEEKDAAEAVDYFVSRVKREIGSLAVANDGIDAVVFTGGIGENSWEIRERICENMEFLGICINKKANKLSEENIGSGPVKVLVIKTDEELVIARAVAGKLN